MGGSRLCCCGISQQKASQYVAIVDVILGLINASVMIVHLSEISDENRKHELYSSSTSSNSEWSSSRSLTVKYGHYTFPGLLWMPKEMVIIVLVCHIVQFVLGIVLYVGAVQKNRSVCIVWLIITGFTVLFTGILLRLYEMAVVYEFSHELKQEQEVSYFPGHHQHLQQAEPQPHTMHLQMIPPIQPNTYPTTFQGISAPPVYQYQPNNSNLYGGYTYNGPNEYAMAPAALQPPPQYDAAVTGSSHLPYGSVGGSFTPGAGDTASFNPALRSTLFPQDKNNFGDPFHKF